MISSVQDYPVSHYFNPDAAQRFFIPKYQREYVWKMENWEALFNDLQESTKGHYLGSIICVNNQRDALAGGQLELIDGQQRFTTISLLFCALYDRLARIPEPDFDLHVELVNLKNRLFVKSTKHWRFEPSEQGYNKADFQKVLSDLFDKELVLPPKGLTHFGNRRIAKAFSYFHDRLEPLDTHDVLLFLDKLKAAVLVKIEVPSHADAFVLFETINNRGIPLSAIDIIKNNLLAELDKLPNYGIDLAFEEWKDLIDQLPEAKVQERFLRHAYNVLKFSSWEEVRGYPRATRSNLITIYDTLLKKDPRGLFNELKVHGRVYSALHDQTIAARDWGASAAEALQDLQRLGAAPAYAFLLWAIHIGQDQKWDSSYVVHRFAELLTRWFFWRNLTDMPPTRELDTMFMDLVSHLQSQLQGGDIKTQDVFVQQANNWLLSKAAPHDVCEARLRGDVYLENYEATRFMLCKLEEAHQTRENKRDLWAHGAKDRRPVFTVEHILPKTENLGAGWVEMLEGDQKGMASVIRERCAHQLGNLTLSGYNSNLGTMDFIKKRDRKNEQGDFIGYRNNLYLNSDLANRESWNEAAIAQRTEKMLKEVMSILSLQEDN